MVDDDNDNNDEMINAVTFHSEQNKSTKQNKKTKRKETKTMNEINLQFTQELRQPPQSDTISFSLMMERVDC